MFACDGSVTTITRNCVIDLHQTGSVGEGSDRLQLIKFWPSCTPGKGSAAGRIFFWFRAVFASLRALSSYCFVDMQMRMLFRNLFAVLIDCCRFGE